MIAHVMIVLALSACGSKTKEPNGEGCRFASDCESETCVHGRCESGLDDATCEKDYHCKTGLQCLAQRCRSRVKKGGACKEDYECDFTLRCRYNQCLDDAGAKLAAADQERRMLEKTGAPALGSGGAETAALPPGPGTRIRTVTISGPQLAVASCKSDERLESGGCKADQVLASYPSGHSELDTVGARWNCTATTEVTAFALCSKVP